MATVRRNNASLNPPNNLKGEQNHGHERNNSNADRSERGRGLLLDDQATHIFTMTDTIADRARKMAGATICSISDIAHNRRLKDNNSEGTSAQEKIAELCDDDQKLARSPRGAPLVLGGD